MKLRLKSEGMEGGSELDSTLPDSDLCCMGTSTYSMIRCRGDG